MYSPTSDFYAFKFVCAVISKGGRDAATVDMPGFFLSDWSRQVDSFAIGGCSSIIASWVGWQEMEKTSAKGEWQICDLNGL